MASASSSAVSLQTASLPTTASPLIRAVSASQAAPSTSSASPSSSRQDVIDLTKLSDSSAQPASKSLFPILPSSLSQIPQIGTKRSPSPNFLASLQTSKGRSPSPALIPKAQSSSQVSYSRSHSPISMIQHSQSDSSIHTSQETAPPPPKKKRLFHRELMSMMRGFGDDPNPYSETVDLIEELVIRFITEMTQKAMDVGKSGRVQVNDIIFIIRKDPKKYSRVKDLLMMKEQIDKAKKAFTEDAETSDE